ncbi:MAG: methyltransferase domain-containing protein [Nanoarchaeota archaeon]
MTPPVFVTQVVNPVPEFDHIGVTFKFSFDGEGGDWWKEAYGDPSFTFPLYNYDLSVLAEALELAVRRRVLISDGVAHADIFEDKAVRTLFGELRVGVIGRDKRLVDKVLEKLRDYTIPSYDEKSPVERWAHMGVQCPSFGPSEVHRNRLQNLLTAKVKGRVLEAMCGFRSYIKDSPYITEVVAMDFCEPLLERYDPPDRPRILYDLERVVAGERMDFFEDASFEAVSICFGVNYLSNPVPVFHELNRILSSPGVLLVVGGIAKGYEDLKKNEFDLVSCIEQMNEAGFSTQISSLDLTTIGEYGEYYLVRGDK